jgi:hypothetical protein
MGREGQMLELMLRLEVLRQRVGKGILTMGSSNGYHFIGTILALVFASGTLGTAFVATPVSVPAGGASFVIFYVTGILAILTIVLWPLGLLLL